VPTDLSPAEKLLPPDRVLSDGGGAHRLRGGCSGRLTGYHALENDAHALAAADAQPARPRLRPFFFILHGEAVGDPGAGAADGWPMETPRPAGALVLVHANSLMQARGLDREGLVELQRSMSFVARPSF